MKLAQIFTTTHFAFASADVKPHKAFTLYRQSNKTGSEKNAGIQGKQSQLDFTPKTI